MRRSAALVAVVALAVLLAACGGRGPKLDATKLTLELAYPPAGDPTAALTGQATAAPDGAKITCRLTDGRRALGTGKAERGGAFSVPLDATAFPLEQLPRQASDINKSIECRAGDGPWVHPLRPPRVAVG